MRLLARYAGTVLGVFVLLGVGLAAVGYALVTELDPGNGVGSDLAGAFLVLVASVVMFYVGPALAAVAGLVGGVHNGDAASSAVAGGLGSFVGFYLMFALAFAGLSVGLTGGADASLGDNAVLLVAVGVATGVVGAACGVVGSGLSGGGTASRVNW